MVMFGGTQLLASQVQSMHGLAWLSTAATVLAISYSPLLLGLSIARAVESGHSHGNAFGTTLASDTLSKIVGVLQAIGNICFSYTFAGVQIEIQDTLKPQPPENKLMRKVISVGILYTTLNYMAIASAGYAAYGNSTPANIVTAFGSFRHLSWLVDLTNILIVLQLIGAYQVLAQPIFAFAEDYASSCIFFCNTDSSNNKSKFPESTPVKSSRFNLYSFWISRAIWRALYVIFTTVIAMRVPYLNSVLGLVGAMVYWPTTIYFPLQMYIKQHHIQPLSSKWIALQLFIYALLIISCCCVGGSVQGMLQSWKSNKVFPF
ncbi:hypothetical protein O6H91_02G126300 [Diphasiastrum complanatum]|uniref:Uncharacterized protein n=1 Tax=Diphasiastrum complanatum TaxID=34168 RepID=A0ACC2EKP9_DIPCM|nr:hypothetical protein O6H91_02G126300 [Diphasiastrum complanatum]